MPDIRGANPEYPLAVYHHQVNLAFRGNPFIEALPPICGHAEAIDAMQNLILVEDEQRAALAEERMHMLTSIEKFVQPLNHHVELFNRISMLMRQGYVDRNPTSANFVRDLVQAAREMEADCKPARGAVRRPGLTRRERLGGGSGLTLIGDSGVGKTTAVESVLRCYPKVINHPELTGALQSVHQIVWLKLSCPQDGSIRGLCLDFLEAMDELLDTNYFHVYGNSGATTDSLQVVMGRISFIHGLGILVIDELQNLSVAKSGGAEKMMNFFKLLRDVMKVPVLCIGTPEAERFLSDEMQVARRNSGMARMERMQFDGAFAFFCESLFDAQFLRNPVAPDGMLEFLYDRSQGIADVVVKMFMLAQYRALSIGSEELTIELFADVYDTCFTLLHPFLNAIRDRQKNDGPSFNSALAKTDYRSLTSLAVNLKSKSERSRIAADRADSDQTEGAPPAIGGVPKRKRNKKAGAESDCVLVQVVADAEKKQIPAHSALLAAGYIRQIDREVSEA